MIALLAAGAVLAGGCGGSGRGTTSIGRTSATGDSQLSTPPHHASAEEQSAQTAVVSRLRHHGFKKLEVSCQQTAGRRRFDCRVNGAQLWQAVVTPSGAVHLRLLGSE